MRGWAPCRWKVGAWNVSVCRSFFKPAFVRTKGSANCCWKTSLLINQTTNQLFFLSLSVLFFPSPTEQQCGKRNACREISSADFMYVLTCKSTPVLVKDGSYSLFSLDGRRSIDGSVLRIESRILDFTTETLCLAEPWKSSFHCFSFFPQHFRHVGHWGWHKGISSDCWI